MSKKNTTAARLHHLQKVLSVQSDYLENYKEGYPKKYVFEKFIRDKYFISERTFWRYLSINAKREIKLLTKEESGAAVGV